MFVIPAPNPIAFNVLGIPIYKYGITLALGIFVAIIVANWLYNFANSKQGEKKDVIIEYAPIIIVVGILCARLYFCLLNPHFYLSHPLEILDIRQGGLSIHGGILGGILSVIFISQKTKIPFLSLMDSLAGATFIGQAIGRWGNYFNSEAFGFPVNGQSWGLFIPQNLRPAQFADFSLFHPTFLYESCLDLVGFFVILFVYKKVCNKYRGFVFFLYLILYATIRFFIEQIRVDSALNVASIPIAEVVSVILFVVGFLGIFVILKKNVKSL